MNAYKIRYVYNFYKMYALLEHLSCKISCHIVVSTTVINIINFEIQFVCLVLLA